MHTYALHAGSFMFTIISLLVIFCLSFRQPRWVFCRKFQTKHSSNPQPKLMKSNTKTPRVINAIIWNNCYFNQTYTTTRFLHLVKRIDHKLSMQWPRRMPSWIEPTIPKPRFHKHISWQHHKFDLLLAITSGMIKLRSRACSGYTGLSTATQNAHKTSTAQQHATPNQGFSMPFIYKRNSTYNLLLYFASQYDVHAHKFSVCRYPNRLIWKHC